MCVCVPGEKHNLEMKCEMVVRADDPELLDMLDQAAEKGASGHFTPN